MWKLGREKKSNSIDKCTTYIFSRPNDCLDHNLSVKILLTNTTFSVDKKPTRCHFCVILYFLLISCSTCFGQPCAPRRRYVVKHNLITEVYLMTVMETITCFGLYWPSSGCLGNLTASYMHDTLPRTMCPSSGADNWVVLQHNTNTWR